MPARAYQDLIIWQKSVAFAHAVYIATRSFPKEELYALTSQLRRAAVSIASNIAEGQGRGVGREFAHFLRITQGSIQEAETQILLAKWLGFFGDNVHEDLLQMTDELSRLNRGLMRSIKT